MLRNLFCAAPSVHVGRRGAASAAPYTTPRSRRPAMAFLL
jgi:hypothetical protein